MLKQTHFKDFETIYQEYIKTRTNISPKHLQRIKSFFERFLLPNFTNSDIKKITRKDVVRALSLLPENPESIKKHL
ncbi:hypothetical protein CPIN18020_1563 [Campylobacter pinnipediorum subsp. caledonicus]|uniref:phage integrase central domain-containing protein n=1 Tax=Campylobacter pinnipediorum TaxID=1965231 RepID=UPI0009C29865|nr:hypothetical protein [Campylobacter pinnipediorum]AQW86742.1 hypothetical protein CPIN18020_1563 [Campylobacter pinnipediorum subsp. caledonicus]